MKVTAIVLAAGKGVRLKSSLPKPLVKVAGSPLISYALKAMNSHPKIDDIIVVVNKDNKRPIERVIKKYSITKVAVIAEGGKRRQDSVYNGLKAVREDASFVLIHDGARPFVDAKIIRAAIKGARGSGACIAGVPVKATIKETAGNRMVARTLKRDNLWEIQTPQVFKKSLLEEAFRKFSRVEVTDEAMLLEKLGVKVYIAIGSYDNIKITTPEDVVVAEIILKRKVRI